VMILSNDLVTAYSMTKRQILAEEMHLQANEQIVHDLTIC